MTTIEVPDSTKEIVDPLTGGGKGDNPQLVPNKSPNGMSKNAMQLQKKLEQRIENARNSRRPIDRQPKTTSSSAATITTILPLSRLSVPGAKATRGKTGSGQRVPTLVPLVDWDVSDSDSESELFTATLDQHPSSRHLLKSGEKDEEDDEELDLMAPLAPIQGCTCCQVVGQSCTIQ